MKDLFTTLSILLMPANQNRFSDMILDGNPKSTLYGNINEFAGKVYLINENYTAVLDVDFFQEFEIYGDSDYTAGGSVMTNEYYKVKLSAVYDVKDDKVEVRESEKAFLEDWAKTLLRKKLSL